MAHKQFIGSAEAARLLDIDRSTLIRWVAAGKITPIVRVSETPTGSYLFKLSDIARIARKRTAA